MKSLFVRFAATAVLAAGLVAAPTAATAHESCESAADIPVVIEFGSLDGEDQVLCAQHAAGTTALEALHDAGVETDETTGSMPMVCRINGQPEPAAETCANELSGPGYWAFLVAKEGQDWGYAAVGLQDYTLAEGDFVVLVYHLLADGENVPVQAAADAQTRAGAVVPGADDSADHMTDVDDEDSDSSFAAFALPIAIIAAALVAAAGFVVARRRRD